MSAQPSAAEPPAVAAAASVDPSAAATATAAAPSAPAPSAAQPSAAGAAPALATAAALRAAAAGAGLLLAEASPELDGSGLDFLVLHGRDAAGTRWIVRTPRRPDVTAAARVEARALALVAGKLPVAVPDWRVHTDEVIAYPRLPGRPAISLEGGAPTWNLDPAAPSAAFIDSLAGALVALQAISPAQAAAAGLPRKPLDDERRAYREMIETTREALAPRPATVARWHAWLDGASWPSRLALVHGDLHPGHLLLDEAGAVSGVLDWTEAHLGDPATDLAMCFGCYGAATFARLLERFEARGGVSWPALAAHAAERWAFFPVLGAAWALRTGSAFALEHARAQLAGQEAAS
jgi:aminoglycoside phosphotransferase (APT) family kinase protein